MGLHKPGRKEIELRGHHLCSSVADNTSALPMKGFGLSPAEYISEDLFYFFLRALWIRLSPAHLKKHKHLRDTVLCSVSDEPFCLFWTTAQYGQPSSSPLPCNLWTFVFHVHDVTMDRGWLTTALVRCSWKIRGRWAYLCDNKASLLRPAVGDRGKGREEESIQVKPGQLLRQMCLHRRFWKRWEDCVLHL